ncbi:MAG: 2-oxoacid:ferredoxin oxidoreductase subunit beta [archaeon GW2011_AR5]|nr:MAG: 2-oxoacid:ferredoxin oxidoreductase subunit beta [archaeon GW2011_AR5]
MPIDVNVQELKSVKNFGDGPPGSGQMLALKLVLQTIDNIILVNSTGTATPFIRHAPFIHAGLNAVSVARGVAQGVEKGTDKKPGTKVVVFAGDGATAISLASLTNVKEDVIYVCANDFGYNAMDYKNERGLVRHVASSAAYCATACVSYPEDFISKLKKAGAMSGFRFIEVLCPSPESWGYEPSNTMEVGRIAVETGIWPLFEVEAGTVNLTKRPNRLEPVENFNHVQKKFQIPADKTHVVQETVNRQWKSLGDGKLI